MSNPPQTQPAKPQGVKPAAPASQKTPVLMRSLAPLIAISVAGLAGSGAVIVIDGGFPNIWIAFILLFLGPVVFPIILVPAGLLAGLWHIMQANKKRGVRVFAAASIAYLAGLLAVTAGVMAGRVDGMPEVSPVFVWMFVLCGSVAPWAAFTLRDRRNQLMIMLLWMQVLAASLMIPAYVTGFVGAVGYGFGVWCIMLAMLALQSLRENRSQPPAPAAAAPAAHDGHDQHPPAQH